MNKTFHSIWNASKQAWVAAAETVSAKGKPTSGAKVAAIVAGLMGSLLGTLMGGAVHAQTAPPPNTLPTGGQVSAGQASIGQAGANMVIQQASNRAAINWQSFNVGSNAQVQFQQPDASSVTLNRVLGSDPSQIFGRISANGQVVLSNPAGVYFAPGARVDVGGLTATTLGINDADFMAGSNRYQRNGSSAGVVNEGELKASLGGYIALLAPEVRNQGAVIAQMGTVALASGETVELRFDNSQHLTSIRVEPSQIQALVDNRHAVQAPGGLVILSAQSLDRLVGGVVSNSGAIEATGLQSDGGRIVLSGSSKVSNSGTLDVNSTSAQGGSVSLQGERIELQTGSRIAATGATGGGTVLVGGNWQGSTDPLLQAAGQPTQAATTVTLAAGASIDASATVHGDGGKVVLWSDVGKADSVTTAQGSVQARGGAQGGNGGQVETSGHSVDTTGLSINAGAERGASGLWLIDPYDYVISDASSINTSLNNGTSVTIDTANASSGSYSGIGGSGNITVSANIGKSSGAAATLTLNAANYIEGSGNINSSGNALAVVFNAGGGTGIYSGLISGNVGVTKSGSGNLSLSAANTYTGGTTISAGVLAVTGTLANNANAAITINDGGTLQLGANDVFGSFSTAIVTPITVNAGGLMTNSGPYFSRLGPLTLNGGTLSSTDGRTVYGFANPFAWAIGAGLAATGNTQSTISGAGNVQLGSASVTGATFTVNDGTATIDLEVSANLSNSSSSTWATTQASSLTKAGAGTMRLSGDNLYGGVTNVNAGTLAVSSGMNPGLIDPSWRTWMSGLGSGAQGVTVASGATLDLRGVQITYGEAITLNGGTLMASTGTSGLVGTVTLGANSTVDVGGTQLTLSGVISGAYSLTKTGTGTLTLSGNNTYTGVTTVHAGTLTAGHNNALGTTAGNTVVASNATLAVSDAVNVEEPLQLSGSGTNNSGALNLLGTNTYSGAITLAANASIVGGTGTQTLSGNVNGAYALAINSSGAWVQSGAWGNATALSSVTVQSAGTASLGNISAQGTIDVATLAGNLTLAGALRTTNTSSSAVVLNAGKSSNALTSSGGDVIVSGASISVGTGGRATLYAGSISGSTGLTNLVGSGSGRFRYGSDELTANYSTALGAGLYAVYRQQPTVSVASLILGMTYGDALPGLSATGTVNGDTAGYAISNQINSSSGNIKASATPYAITETLTGLGYLVNNTSAASTGTLTVDPKAITMGGLSSQNKTYDGTISATVNGTAALQAAIAAGSGTSSDGKPYTSDAVSISGTATGSYNSKDVATANSVTFSGLSLSGADAGNYSLTIQSPASATITAKTLTVNGLSSQSKTYDGTTSATVNGTAALQAAIAAGSGTSSDGKPYASDVIGLSGTAQGSFNSQDVADANQVSFSGLSLSGAAASNYTLTPHAVDTSARITQAPLTVTANNANKTYDAQAYSGGNGVGYSGFVGGESASVLGGTLSYGGSSQGATNAGSYTIVPSGLSSNNYAISYANGTLTVAKANATVTANSGTLSYNGAYQTVSGFTASGLVGGETAAVLTGVSASRTEQNAGTYTTTASGTDSNYNLSFVNGAMLIQKAALTATGNSALLTYNGANQSVSGFTVSGLLGSDTVSSLTSIIAAGATGKNAGSYANTITAGTETNYTVTTINGSLDIAKANATVTANSGTLAYNGAHQTVSGFTASGLVGGETAAVLTGVSASRTELNAGTYTTTANGTDSNYNLSFVNGAMLIQKAALTATGNSALLTYNGANQSVSGFTVSGLLGADTVSSLTSIVAAGATGKNAGSYANTITAGTETNYTVTTINGSLDIAKANATVTANSGTLTYNGAHQTVSGFTASGLVGGETAAVLTGVSASRTEQNAGTYTTTANGTDSNYNLSFVDGSMVINPATISVMAITGTLQGSVSKVYDGGNAATLQASNYVLIGWAGSDGATVSKTVGTYDNANVGTGKTVTVALGTSDYSATGNTHLGNYTLPTSISGTVGAITAAPLTVTANNASKTHDGLPYIGGNGVGYSGFVNGETASVLGGTLRYGGSSQGAVDAGNGYTIVLSGLSSHNYAINYADGTLTIYPAAIVINPAPAPVTHVITTNPANTSLSNHILTAPPSSSAATVSSSAPSSPATLATGITVDLLNVNAREMPMMVAVSLPKGTTTVGTGFSFEMPETVKSMAMPNAPLQINQSNGAALPAWLKFDPVTMRFEATSVPDTALPMQLQVNVAGQRLTVVISERGE